MRVFFLKMEFYFGIPALLYIPVVFGLQFLVQNCNEGTKNYLNFALKPYNIAWDFALSIFSFMGAYYTIKQLYEEGFTCNIVNNSFWVDIFCYSKVPELIDTLFIVLRSGKLLTIHWFHHIATLLLCWFAMYFYAKEALLAAAINFSIHSVMYLYYALVAAGLRSLRKYGFIITFFQTLQMFIAMFFILFVEVLPCKENAPDITYMYWYCFILFTIYIYMFGSLFIEKVSQKLKGA